MASAATATASVCFTGHSLGSALSATLAFAMRDAQAQWDPTGKATVTTINFAGPTAGAIRDIDPRECRQTTLPRLVGNVGCCGEFGLVRLAAPVAVGDGAVGGLVAGALLDGGAHVVGAVGEGVQVDDLDKQLEGLKAGETRHVTFTLKDRALSIVDPQGVRRIVPGMVEAWVGGGQPVTPAGLPQTAGGRTSFRITGTATLPE